MTTETPGDASAIRWNSIRIPEKARRHLEDMREARAQGQWADELDDWCELVGSLDREQRQALISELSHIS